MPIQEVIKFSDTKQRSNKKLERLICDKTADLVTGGKPQINVNCTENNIVNKKLNIVEFHHFLSSISFIIYKIYTVLLLQIQLKLFLTT